MGTESPLAWVLALLMLGLVALVVFGVAMIIRHWND
jgi:hypothetical protein